MVRIRTDLPNTSARREEAPQWRAPLGSQRTHRHRPDAEAMQKAPIAVHHRSACSGVKALRNTTVGIGLLRAVQFLHDREDDIGGARREFQARRRAASLDD